VPAEPLAPIRSVTSLANQHKPLLDIEDSSNAITSITPNELDTFNLDMIPPVSNSGATNAVPELDLNLCNDPGIEPSAAHGEGQTPVKLDPELRACWRCKILKKKVNEPRNIFHSY
jgi:hypothetical protein